MGKCKKALKKRSEIPYVQRMQMERAEQMAWHRNDAARIAMQIACVALNNTEGLGYTRLVRFAQETVEKPQRDPLCATDADGAGRADGVAQK